jgi:hypothetical protein
MSSARRSAQAADAFETLVTEGLETAQQRLN